MDEDSTTSPDNLFQCLTTQTIKVLLMFRWNILYFSLCPLPLVLSLGTRAPGFYNTLIRNLPSPNKQYLNPMKKKTKLSKEPKTGGRGSYIYTKSNKIHLKENSGEMNGDRSKSQFKTIDLK